jgi:non-ribosomal peptide synthase protein (TIGR01720 family)
MTDLKFRVQALSDDQLHRLQSELFPHPASSSSKVAQALVAFVVASDSIMPDASDILSGMAKALPSHMVPDEVVFLDTLPRLANGKTDMRALKSYRLPEPVRSTEVVSARSDTEIALTAIWSELLNMEPIGILDNFFELGGDSILSIQLVSRARQAGIGIEPRDIAEHPTISALAQVALSRQLDEPTPSTNAKSAPALPIQRWFLDRALEVPAQWNMSRWFDIAPGVPFDAIKAALQDCVQAHPALRMGLQKQNGAWMQVCLDTTSNAALSTVTSDVLAECAARAQQSMDLGGPLLRAVLCSDNPTGSLLFLAVHHLAIDAVSWQILTDDLNIALTRRIAGRPTNLPAAASPLDWAIRLDSYANSKALGDDLSAWSAPPAPETATVPTDFQRGSPLPEGSAKTEIADLTSDITEALTSQANRAFHTQPLDLMLTALARTLAEWTKRRDILIELEGNGRGWQGDTTDLSRTVGWLTSYFPVWFDIDPGAEDAQLVPQVKEQLRQFSRNDLSFGVAKYMSTTDRFAAIAEGVPKAEVLFNYLGTMQAAKTSGAWITPSPMQADLDRYPNNVRAHILEFNVWKHQNKLHIGLTYSPERHKAETISRLLDAFCTHLTKIVRNLSTLEEDRFTPSDFPEAEMSQDDLDSFLDGL